MKNIVIALGSLMQEESEKDDTPQYILLMCSIQFAQQLSIILPNNTFQNIAMDKYYQVFQAFISLSLGEFQQLEVLTIVIVIFNLGVFLILILISKMKNLNLAACKSTIYQYLIFIQGVLFWPQLNYLLYQLFTHNQISLFNIILKITGAISLIILRVTSNYFIRNTYLKLKYQLRIWSHQVSIGIILEIALISIHSNQNINHSYVIIIKYLIFVLYLINEFIDLIFNSPFFPYETICRAKFIIVNQFNVVLFLIFFFYISLFNDSQYAPIMILDLLVLYLGEQIAQFIIQKQIFSPQSGQLLQFQFLKQLKSIRCNQNQLIEEKIYLKNHRLICDRNCNSNNVEEVVECLKQNHSKNSEEISLFIIFLSQQNVEQLLYCFMQVQMISQNALNNTMYFKLRLQLLKTQVESKILQHFYKNENEYEQDRKLQSSYFLNFCRQEQSIVSKVNNIIGIKISIMKYCLIETIEAQSLQDQICDLSEFIEEIQVELEVILHQKMKEINLYSVSNLIHLKLLQQYYMNVVKDITFIIIAEKQIQTVLAFERYQNQDDLSFSAYLEDRITILSIRLLKNIGSIINANFRHLNQFFDIQHKNEVYFKHINQLIPSFLTVIHDDLLEEFLTTADTIFFTQFRTLFATSLEGFIQYVKVQFTNDFTVLDDLVIQITIQKPLKIIETVIFDEQGKMLGITKQLFQNLFLQYDSAYTLEKLTEQGQIFLFLPEIFQILKRKFRSRQKNILNQNTLEQATFYPLTCNELGLHLNNLSEALISPTKISSTRILSLQLALRQRQNRRKSILYDQSFAEHIRQTLNRNLNSETIKIKFQIDFTQLQSSKQKLSYYVLTISDLKYDNHKDKSWNSSFFNSQVSQDMPTEVIQPERGIVEAQEFQMNQKVSNTNSCQLRYELPIYVGKPQDKSVTQIQHISMSQDQPFTSRPEFDKPFINDHVEENFAEFAQFSSNSSFKNPNEQQASQDNFHDGTFQNNICKMTRSSIDKDYRSQQLSSLQQFKKFQNSTRINNHYKVLGLVNIFTLILIFTFILESLIYCQQMNDLSIENLKYVNAPLQCNRYFSKVASLNWLLVLQTLKQVNKSELLINKAISEIENLRVHMTNDMKDTTALFIDIETRGLTQELIIDLLFVRNVTSNITQFIDVLQIYAASIFRTNNLTFKNLKPTLNSNGLNSMFIIRYNFKNFYYANDQLLTELSTMFHVQIENSTDNLFTILVVNACSLTMLMFFQIFLQCKIKSHNNKILLILAYFTENEAKQELDMLNKVKIKFIEEGRTNWRKQGYFEFDHLNPKSQANQSNQTSYLRTPTQQKLESISPAKKRDQKIKEKMKQGNLNFKSIASQFFLSIIFLLLFQISGYVFYDYSKEKLYPLQNSTNNFVRFSAQIDLLVACLQIIKTQPLLFQGLIDAKLYTNKSIQAIRDGRKIFKVFYQIMDNFSAKLQEQFADILNLDLDSQQLELLHQLYSQNLCNSLYDELYQCQLQNLSNSQFSELYGDPFSDDNNLEYIANGIQGIVTRLQKFIYENYDFELQTPDYLPNNTELSVFSNSQLFNALVFSHFTFTYQAILKFLNILMVNFENTITSLARNLIIYYIIGGLFSIIGLSIFNYIYLKSAITTLMRLRKGLSLLPKHYQVDSTILQSIRILEHE